MRRKFLFFIMPMMFVPDIAFGAECKGYMKDPNGDRANGLNISTGVKYKYSDCSYVITAENLNMRYASANLPRKQAIPCVETYGPKAYQQKDDCVVILDSQQCVWQYGPLVCNILGKLQERKPYDCDTGDFIEVTDIGVIRNKYTEWGKDYQGYDCPRLEAVARRRRENGHQACTWEYCSSVIPHLLRTKPDGKVGWECPNLYQDGHIECCAKACQPGWKVEDCKCVSESGKQPTPPKSGSSSSADCISKLTLGESEEPCKPGYSYKVCQIGNGETKACEGAMLPSNATKGQCTATGRNGYKICIADECKPGFTPSGGRCKQNSTPTSPSNSEYNPTECTTSGGTPDGNGGCTCDSNKGLKRSENNTNKCECTDSDATLDKSQNKCIKPEPAAPTPENTVCVPSGGKLNDGGKCDCPADKNLTANSDKTACVCSDPDNQEFNEQNKQCVQKPETTSEPEAPIEQKPEPEAETPTEPKPEPEGEPDADAEQRLADAQSAYDAAKANEQSWANRSLTAASTAATGLGMMEAFSAYSEQKADKEAEEDMRAYLATMKCEYGGGKNIEIGNEDITLPGGNELLEYYTEYKQLADQLRNTKNALGLRPGIESETLYDRAQSGLYQYATANRQTGAYTSLSRALTDKESEDAAAWAEQKDASKTKLTAGIAAAGVGIAGGIIGNYFINYHNKTHQELTDDMKQEQTQIEQEHPNDVLINPSNVNFGNFGGFNTDITPFRPSVTPPAQNDDDDTPPVQEYLTNLSIKDKTLFASGRYKINGESQILNDYSDSISRVLNQEKYKDVHIEIKIIGHTDKVPVKPGQAYKDNQQLSEWRANSVKEYLERKLYALSARITCVAEGRGERQCTKSGNQPDCRRVEVIATDVTQYPNEE